MLNPAPNLLLAPEFLKVHFWGRCPKTKTKWWLLNLCPLTPPKVYLLDIFGWFDFYEICFLLLPFPGDASWAKKITIHSSERITFKVAHLCRLSNNFRASRKHVFQYTICSMINISSENLGVSTNFETYQHLIFSDITIALAWNTILTTKIQLSPIQILKVSTVSTIHQCFQRGRCAYLHTPPVFSRGFPALVAVRMTIDEFLGRGDEVYLRHCWIEKFLAMDKPKTNTWNGSAVLVAVSGDCKWI